MYLCAYFSNSLFAVYFTEKSLDRLLPVVSFTIPAAKTRYVCLHCIIPVVGGYGIHTDFEDLS